MNRLTVSALCLFLLIDVIPNDARILLRKKRDASPFDGLLESLSQFTKPLFEKKGVQSNDIPASPPVPAGQASGAGILPAVGVCDGGDQVRCDYMACLADNFKNSQHANSIKQGSQVMMDPELRSAITNDPQISKIACDKAQLDATGCNGFLQLLGLVNKIDPKSHHINDEPREKRSPDYYDETHKSPSGSSSSGSSSQSKNSKPGDKSPLSQGGSSSSAASGSFGQQKDCEAILRQNRAKGKTTQPLKQRRTIGKK